MSAKTPFPHSRDQARELILETPGFAMRSRLGSSGLKDKGHWEHLWLAPDLFVSSVNGPASFVDEVDPFDSDYIEFQFRFEGAIDRAAITGAAGRPVSVGAGSLLVYRNPGQRTTRNALVQGDRNIHVSIFCKPAFLDRTFGDFRHTLNPFIAAGLSEDTASPMALSVALYPRLSRTAHELARSHFTTARRLVQAEGYVLVLIAEVMAILEAEPDRNGLPAHLSDRDFDKIHKLRALLIRSPVEVPSLKELSKQVGLGETKLKTGFKALFGQSIFAFTHDLRMRHARDLLRNNEMSIAQVAAAVGYEYQNSFTVAFRKHFGTLPRAYRRNPVDMDEAEMEARRHSADQGRLPDNALGMQPLRQDGDAD